MVATLFVAAAALPSAFAQDSGPTQGLKGGELRKALNDDAAEFWIYDDLEAGYAAARKSGKPLLVTLRCVP